NLLETLKKIAVVDVHQAGEDDNGSVMPVVIPYYIKVIDALLSGPNQFCLLEFIFHKQKDGSLSDRLPRRAPDRSHDVFLRFVMNALGRIEPETVKMNFLDPVAY